MFKIGDVVFFDHGYGKIVAVNPHWRVVGMAPLYTVKYIDPKTGEIMKCPDSRCTTTCGICSRNLWAEDMRCITKTDEDFYRKEGMLR